MSDLPTAEQLDEIEQRVAAASPGPWRRHDCWLDWGGHTATVLRGPADEPCVDGVAWLPSRRHDVFWDEARNVWNDAQFIAAARQDVPALLAAVRKLRTDLEISTTARTVCHRDHVALADAARDLLDAIDDVDWAAIDAVGADISGPYTALRKLINGEIKP